MFIPATSIDEVITSLENIITRSIQTKTRAGYFATLYLSVTQSIKEGIDKGLFQNGARMEKLDVVFANRYLQAYHQWENKETLSACWQYAFRETEKSSVLIIQHLMLGISAHINLDLGIATAQIQAGRNEPLKNIRDDFYTINTIISSYTYKTINDLNKVSPLLSLMGLHASNSSSVLIQFSTENARDGAWCFAEELYDKAEADLAAAIQERDQNILRLGKSIVKQQGLLAFTIWMIHVFEWKNPQEIIAALSANKKQHFTVGQNL
ncbi:MAG: DUF5995 family protein [Cytophaga sp.]|uniref:DUF5995 family protein n=1 Tax=Cytophaga sp. TaxID=29535 RepID=UPI003F7E4C25